MSRKLRIFLGDPRYFTEGTSFPLGIGFLAATIRERFGSDIDVRCFIEPQKLLDSIRQQPPDILGLANYTWNRALNAALIRLSKAASPRTLTVMGGPAFSRDDKPWLERFFRRNESLDFYVAGAGEFAFEEIVRLALAEPNKAIEHVQDMAFRGLFFRSGDLVHEGSRHVPTIHERRKNLDCIPSPYLTGTLDEYFSYRHLGPMIETVRGCPYACTFCCWGSRLLNKISSFSLDRVASELHYISSRAARDGRLFFGDANFGLLDQDLEVARIIRDIHQRTGWPRDVYLYMAKNAGERVIEIARLLRGLTKVSLARQSMSPDVLASTKRANLDDQTFAKVQEELGLANVESMVELIYPLPGETKQSFLGGIDNLFKQVDPRRTEVRMYPTELLPGSELASTESREKYGLVTGWRKLSGHELSLSGTSIAEYQEIVLATNTFSSADQHDIRLFHFMFSMFLTYRLFDPILEVIEDSLRKAESGIGEVIDTVILRMKSDPKLELLLDQFASDVSHESTQGIDAPDANEGDQAGISGATPANRPGQQRRFNIYYALMLLYAEEGALRQSFMDVTRKYLTQDLGVPDTVVVSVVESVNAGFVDFNALAGEIEGGLSKLAPQQMESPVYSEFLKRYDGDVVQALYSMYSSVAGGHLGRMVLASKLH